ncbi:MAG: CopD family protein [Nitrospinota bacterium]|nr:CopD family protein [Nitrospinota bacterium]MEC8956898.1 CopD family protein [Nitrospinota bacterium]MEC9019180.1 CopD family protein [Nitrospinota bacterium]MED5353304.1 CopD family protein [Nitrospinota bacterium]MEE3253606.1 CopD family protein [Nitrospinota bacterium]
MNNFFLTLHMISMCLVIGTLFLQSLSVVFRLRLKSTEEAKGLEKTQSRIHKFIYYPILGVTIISGIVLAIKTEAFAEGKWIHWKLALLIVLIALGIQNGKQIKEAILPKKYAMMVHIAIFIVGACMIYLATIKPF